MKYKVAIIGCGFFDVCQQLRLELNGFTVDLFEKKDILLGASGKIK